MKTSVRLAVGLLGVVLLASPLRANEPLYEGLGTTERAVTAANPQARKYAVQGIKLLYGFSHGAAIRSFEQAIKHKSRFPEAHNNRGGVLVTLGRYPDSLVGFDRALAIKPDYADAHYNRGYALHNLPAETRLPWHRVVAADGRIAKRAVPDDGRWQQELLEEEGIELDVSGGVPLEKYAWRPRARRA